MRAAVTTIGCRLNQFESDAIERLLREAGWEIVGSPEQADLHIINSCSITNQADADTRQLVRRSARTHPNAKVVVTGCYANASPQDVAELPGVRAVVGNADKARLAEHLRALGDDAPAIHVQPFAKRFDDGLVPAIPEHRSRVYLKVQDGCDYRCAFCIVPSVRGPSRSLSFDSVLSQLDRLIEAGVPEVVLTGIHLGSYGRDLEPPVRFIDLVSAMLPRLAGTRLRLSSLDPHEVDDHLIALMANNRQSVCRHLHLPLQSGDNTVLGRMRRAHTASRFERVVVGLHTAVPGIAIGADVIVGFPGETDEQFENTYALVRRLPVAYLHVFSYSKRAGTPAAEMTGQVVKAVRRQRSELLRRLSDSKRQTFVASCRGHQMEAVIQQQRHRCSGLWVGLTDNYIRVQLEDPDALGGQRVPVRVQQAVEDGHGARALLVSRSSPPPIGP